MKNFTILCTSALLAQCLACAPRGSESVPQQTADGLVDPVGNAWGLAVWAWTGTAWILTTAGEAIQSGFEAVSTSREAPAPANTSLPGLRVTSAGIAPLYSDKYLSHTITGVGPGQPVSGYRFDVLSNGVGVFQVTARGGAANGKAGYMRASSLTWSKNCVPPPPKTRCAEGQSGRCRYFRTEAQAQDFVKGMLANVADSLSGITRNGMSTCNGDYRLRHDPSGHSNVHSQYRNIPHWHFEQFDRNGYCQTNTHVYYGPVNPCSGL